MVGYVFMVDQNEKNSDIFKQIWIFFFVVITQFGNK